MSVNVKSLLTSGLISGFIINVSAIAMVPMVGDQFDTVLADRGLPPLSIQPWPFLVACHSSWGFSWCGCMQLPKFIRARDQDGGNGIRRILVFCLFYSQCVNGRIWFHASQAYRDWDGLGISGIVW
jgi:hypothetical protein